MSAQDPTAGGASAQEPRAGDAQLWTRASQGDVAAREQLAELSLSATSSELTRRGVRGAELADLVQEAQRTTFAFLARNPSPPKDLWTFLKYRAWGVLSDHRKKMRASPLDFRGDFEPAVRRLPEAGPAADRLGVQEVGAALADCRRKLPVELGRVLAMRYDAELATEGIQRRLGVHRNTIHVRVFRALEKLRECMGAKGFGPEDLQ
ncbi:MAG TPA: sigma-70 family RNA polymerase sigma factor [Planctomycetota bacterium]|nr:sigma-70 family RNA polymerase sigma factor [Planctomycetota bacterium]